MPSATVLCRATAFDDAGGFPDLWPGDDWVLFERMHRRGCAVRKLRRAITQHLHPRGWREFFAHQYRLGSTSAQARSMTHMTGGAFVRHPYLAPLLFVGRAARAALWLARHRPREIPLFIALLPLYVAGLGTWTAGFTASALRRA